MPNEPRLARAAAMVADPTRSRMLAYLLSGEYASAGELARSASVTPATASGHLQKLLDASFVVCESRGRHRYYRLANTDVAHALEALAIVAERGVHEETWQHPDRIRLRFARCCYGHLAGRIGVALFSSLHTNNCLKSTSQGFQLTSAGHEWLSGLRMTPPAPSPERRFAFACLDWSERRDHLAGQLADEIFGHFVHMNWLRKATGRIVEVTPAGRKELLPRLGDSALELD
jgi:DNA-binding transcriptional ArsR family regulator